MCTDFIRSMGVKSKIQGNNKEILVYGSNHITEDRFHIQDLIKDFRPQVVCAEAVIGKDIAKHTVEIVTAKDMSKEYNADFWHIDINEENISFSNILSNLDNDEKDQISGSVNTKHDSQRMRSDMKEVSETMHNYNLRRESFMIGAISEAINRYDRILVIVGGGHYSTIRNHIYSLM